MYVCKKCGWLYSGSHCPRCGMAARTDDDLSEVTLSGYGDTEDYGTKEEREAEAREFLWDAMHSDLPDPDTCLTLAADLRSCASEDYYANFVDVVFSGSEDLLIKFLTQPRVKGAEMFAEPVLDYMCAHMSTKLYPVVKRYLEKSDIAQPEKYEAVIDSYLSDYLKKERDEAEEKKRKEDSDRLEAAARDTAEKIVKGLAEFAVRDAAERAEAELKETLERRESEVAEKLETAAREAAEKIVKGLAEKKVSDAVGRAVNDFREAEDRRAKEESGKIDAAVREAAERIVKQVAEREIREINERKERESREAEERERKEKEERRKVEDERKRREQMETADKIEKERREAEAAKRKREEENVLSPDGYSKGFEFEKWGLGCDLTWIGDCDDSDILIPPVYNGSPITGVGDKAFVGCKDIKSVAVPSGVTSVGNEAFTGCTGLESVKLPDTLETIGESAFKGCTALKTVDMPAVTTIGKSAFSGCGALSKLTLPEGLKIIKDEAFYDCSGKLNDGVMFIPSGVTKIGEKAFYFTFLSKIYIPVTVTSIGNNAFSIRTTLYYLGTKSQWNGIVKDRFLGGIVHFYSALRPRELGLFWHYDENGNTVEW